MGGYARFVGKVRSYDALNPLILFSGDLFSPSNREYRQYPRNANSIDPAN